MIQELIDENDPLAILIAQEEDVELDTNTAFEAMMDRLTNTEEETELKVRKQDTRPSRIVIYNYGTINMT